MDRLLRNLEFGWFSFILGFLAGSVFWFLFRKIKPHLVRLRENLRTQTQVTRGERLASDEIRLANDILLHAQKMHIAEPLFSLEEILIPARFLPPPQQPDYKEEGIPVSDITDGVIPYMPDWPQMASYYKVPSMSIRVALESDTHLVVTGAPGSGKSVALAHLAIESVNQSLTLRKSNCSAPVLVQAAELLLPAGPKEELLSPLISAVNQYTSPKTAAVLPTLLPSLFTGKGVLLILDGLDEFPPNEFDQVVHYLNDLMQYYPKTRVVTTACPEYFGRLLHMNFAPMIIASWDQEQRADFLKRWGTLWSSLAEQQDNEKSDESVVDPLLIHGWLLSNTGQLSPLELTLKLWAAYAGDTLGHRSVDDIEAYVRRMTFNRSPQNRPAFERMCSKIVLTMQPYAHRNIANQWLSGEGAQVPTELTDLVEGDIGATHDHFEVNKVPAPKALTDLIKSGLIQELLGDRVAVVHSVITGYLASQSLARNQVAENLLTQPDWTGQRLTLRYIAAQEKEAIWINQLLLEDEKDIAGRGMLAASSWLKDAREDATWSRKLLRILADSLKKDDYSTSLKSRILTALVESGDRGVEVLFKQMLASEDDNIRKLSILGAGMLRDRKATSEISKMINDSDPLVNRAAILALVAIGDEQALEAVAYTLLNGDDFQRRAAAEGLSNNVEEGYPTLKEASELEDHNVRRSAVVGLARTRQSWAVEILENMRTNDDQWVVQDAASNALDELASSDPRLPKRLPHLSAAPWLIEFAGERGIGVSPGKPAYALLHKTLTEGTEGQKLAALYHLCYHGNENSILPLYQCYYSSSGEVREATFNALWHISKTGIELPPPTKFSLIER